MQLLDDLDFDSDFITVFTLYITTYGIDLNSRYLYLLIYYNIKPYLFD